MARHIIEPDLSEATEKTTPVSADTLLIADSAASNALKRVQIGNLPGGGTVDVVSNVATSTLLGRVTAGSGDSEELTATQVRTILNVEDGANNYVHPNHSGDVTSVADGATTIANGAVTLAKQANMATASLVYRKTAGAGAPEVNTLATLKTDLGLTGTNSGDQTLPTRDSLGLDTDDSPQFAGVELGHATDTTLSRVSAGVVAVEGVNILTTATGMTNPMTTGGDVIYGGASGVPTRLANGTAGQVLTSAGTTLAPTWSTVAGAGDVTKVGTPVDNQIGVWTGDGTIEGTANLTFDGGAVVTVPDGANKVGLTINQNDVTNNQSPFHVVNANNGYEFILENTSSGAYGSSIKMYHNSSSPAINDEIGTIEFYGNESVATEQFYASIIAFSDNVTSGAESSSVLFRTKAAGVTGNRLRIGGTINGVAVGRNTESAVITSNGQQDLILRTGNTYTTTGNITIVVGENGNIEATPNGSGKFKAPHVPRTGTVASAASPTINTDNVDYFSITAQTEAIASFTTNLSGTPTEGQKLWIAITGTAARAITWGATFENGPVALPTTTVTTTRLDVGFIWNSVTSKWRCVATGSTV